MNAACGRNLIAAVTSRRHLGGQTSAGLLAKVETPPASPRVAELISTLATPPPPGDGAFTDYRKCTVSVQTSVGGGANEHAAAAA